jgi:hypothetical protein
LVFNSIGLHRYFTRLYKVFGITMEPCVAHYLFVKENIRVKRHAKNKLRKTKKARKERQYTSLREQEKIARKERSKRDGTYKTGQNMDEGGADRYTEAELLLAAAAAPPTKKKAPPRRTMTCPLCGKAGHTTARSRRCTHYGLKPEAGKPNAAVPAVPLQATAAPPDIPQHAVLPPSIEEVVGEVVEDFVMEEELWDPTQANDDISVASNQDLFVDAATWDSSSDEDASMSGAI